uniref:Caspase n=1 Tax=Phlebotomus papatasi TaxID=29031 RepID=A0A1B0D650_PHLPP
MPFGNSGQRTNDFQRSQSLMARTSNTSYLKSSGHSVSNYSETKSRSTSSSSSYHAFSSSIKTGESVFGKSSTNRSSINKPEYPSLLKEHFHDSVAFTNAEKGSFLERRQPFRTTLNSPTGSYLTNTTVRRNAPPLTGVTFSGLSPLSLPKYEPPPIPMGSDAVKAQSIPVSPPKKSGTPIPLPVPPSKNTINQTKKVKTPTSPTKPQNVYDINGKKGYAIIFNNEKFDGDSKEFRVGSRNDEKELQKTLTRFNIETKVERDPSLSTIEKKVKEISKMDFKKKSCLFVCILSHGNQGQTIFAKDKSYNLDKDVIEPIIKNATLVGKPKIFIIQACKGAIQSFGIAMTDATPVSTSSLTKPSEADILILYSSYEGRVSYRLEMGSIFIQKLCTFINSDHRIRSLEDIMKETRRDIIDNSPQNLKQTPTMVSTLTKDFFFTV